MTSIASLAAELGIRPIEARLIVSRLVREALEGDARPRTRTRWSTDEILSAIRLFVESVGRLPRKAEWDPHGSPPLPSRKTVARKIGGIPAAYEAAGVLELELRAPAIEVERPTLFEVAS